VPCSGLRIWKLLRLWHRSQLQIWSLAWELLYTVGVAKKKKKKVYRMAYCLHFSSKADLWLRLCQNLFHIPSVGFRDDLFRSSSLEQHHLHKCSFDTPLHFVIIKNFEKVAFYNGGRGIFISVWWVRSVVLNQGSAYPLREHLPKSGDTFACLHLGVATGI